MARINRSDVIQKAVNDLALQPAADKIPSETLDKVQLVYSLNKHYSNFIINNSSTSTGTLSISFPSVSAGSEIYVTCIDAGLIKDATCDMATAAQQIQLTPYESVAKNIGHIPTITLTAQDQHVTIPLPYPLRVKQGTTVTMSGSFTVGACCKSLSVTGFTTSSN